MKKILIVLLFIFVITSPAYAVNIVDIMLYKAVVLSANHTTVLVNRFTGEVKYKLRQYNKEWVLLKGARKKEYQAAYNAQAVFKKP